MNCFAFSSAKCLVDMQMQSLQSIVVLYFESSCAHVVLFSCKLSCGGMQKGFWLCFRNDRIDFHVAGIE